MCKEILFIQASVKIRELFANELEEFGFLASSMYEGIDSETAKALATSFLVSGLINEKLILKKKDFENGTREYQTT